MGGLALIQASVSTDSPGGLVTDPKVLPIIASSDDHISIKSALSTLLSSYDAAAYWTAIAQQGAYVTGVVNDTWKTVVDLSSVSGKVAGVLGPEGTGIHYIRITVDGTAYTFTSSSMGSATRLYWGLITGEGRLASGSEYGVPGPNSDQDPGFAYTQDSDGTLNDVASTPYSAVSPLIALCYGMPLLRYETSLKVEVKVAVVGGNTYDPYAGVLYLADGDWS